MGLTDALARYAVRHAHVLVAEVAGHWHTRAAVEAHLFERGWTLAWSPADADVLAVCGTPGPQLSGAVEQVWHQMPGPRVRIDVDGPDVVARRLDDAAVELLDGAHHQEDSRTRPAGTDLLPAEDHGGMDHGGMDHGGHMEMDMAPGGIPLAEGGDDRDGLEMDVLNVPLGPILPHWRAGLVLRCSVQGDVIMAAEAQVLDATTQLLVDELPAGPARRCDNIVGLLALAGWDDAAAEARHIRDEILADTGADKAMTAKALTAVAHRLESLQRKVTRSWLLRWSLRGVGPVPDLEIEQRGLPQAWAGDTYDRLVQMIEHARVEMSADLPSDDGRRAGGARVSVEAIPHLVTGLDLATARLVVASLDLDALPAGHGVARA